MTNEAGPRPFGNRTFPFIVGRGRSGTTMIRAIFDSHPEMAVPHESHFIPEIARAVQRKGGLVHEEVARFVAPVVLRRWQLPPDAVRAAILEEPRPLTLADAIRNVYAAYAHAHGATHYADKTPYYVGHLDLIAGLFPEARIIHMIRDGRDSTLSSIENPFGPTSVAEGAMKWKRYVAKGRRDGKALGRDRYMEVRYEEFVDDPQTFTREICEFIDLDFREDMLRYNERAQQIVGPRQHHRNVYRPPTKGLRDWRQEMAPRDVETFEIIAGDLLTELGYERSITKPTFRMRTRAQLASLRVNLTRAGFHSKRLVFRAARKVGINVYAKRASTHKRVTDLGDLI